MNKDVRQLVKALKKQGFEIETGGRHMKVKRPGYQGSVTVSRTPSDIRGLKNSIGLLRRDFGFKWKGR